MAFSITPVVSEALEGSILSFSITSTEPVPADTVLIVLVSGFGANPVDASDFSGPLSFSVTLPAGQTSGYFTLEPVADALAELTETFLLELANVDPAEVIGGPFLGAILQDPVPPRIIDFSVGGPLNPGNTKGIVIDVITGLAQAGVENPATGDITWTPYAVSDLITPAGTNVPYALTDNFVITAELGGAVPNISARSDITTADGNDSIQLTQVNTLSSIIAGINTGGGDDLVDIASSVLQPTELTLDGGTGDDTLVISGNAYVTLTGVEHVRLGGIVDPLLPMASYGVTLTSLDGVQSIEFSDPSANAYEYVYAYLQAAGVHDYSGITVSNAAVYVDPLNLEFADTFTVQGTSGNDTIIGPSNVNLAFYSFGGDDLLIGANFDDDLGGGSGNDSMRGGGGVNSFLGDENAYSAGEDVDTAIFSGRFADYTIANNAILGIAVIDNGAADGSRPAEDGYNSLYGVEVLHFNGDGSDHYVPIFSAAGNALGDTIEVALAAGQTAVGQYLAVDPDGGGRTYSVVPFAGQLASGIAPTDPDKFQIDATTGALSLIGPQPAGTYSALIQAIDADGLFDTLLVTVTIPPGGNLPPVAVDDLAILEEDGSLIVPAGRGLLANDTDPDGGTLMITGFTVGGQTYAAGEVATITGVGDLTVLADGGYAFVPAPNYNGGAPVTYIVTDGQGGGVTGTLTLQVNAVNDAPINSATTNMSVDEDGEMTFAPSGNPFTISDVDASTGNITTTLTVQHGTLSATGFAAASSLTIEAPLAQLNAILSGLVYTPAENYAGLDQIFIHTSDNGSTGGSARVQDNIIYVTVNAIDDAPILHTPISDQNSPEDVPVNFTLPAGMFTDVDDATLTLTADLGAAAGWLSFDPATGTFTGTPPQDTTGSFDITVTATDSGALSASTTFRLNITPVNDAPVLVEFLETIEFAENTVNAAPQLVAAFGGPFGSPIVTDIDSTDFGGGQLIVRLNTQVNGTTGVIPMPLAERPQNQLGIQNAGTGLDQIGLSGNSVTWNGAVIGTISSTDNGLNGNDLVVDLTSFATPVAVTALARALTYQNTSDTPIQTRVLTVQVTDGDGGTSPLDTGLVSGNRAGIWVVTIAAENDAPVAQADSGFTAVAGLPMTIAASTLTANDSDPDGTTPTILSVGGATHGTVALNGDGSITFTANPGYAGPATFSYVLTDGTATSAPALVTINVAGVIIYGNDGNNVVSATRTVPGQPLPTIYGDIIYGYGGSDRLDGALGPDLMYGGSGNDTYTINDVGDRAIEFNPITHLDDGGIDTVLASVSFNLAGLLENLTLQGSGAINGTGNELDNRIAGTGGNNILIGMEGNDSLTGNAGDDQLYGMSGNNRLYGGDGSDQLYGGDGNDVLDGGTGADVMTGWFGNDRYVVDNAGDLTIEGVSGTDDGGIDLVQTSVSYIISAYIENLTMTGTAAINTIGNDLANTIRGNDAANHIDAGGGADIILAGGGSDSLFGGAGSDRLDGGSGADAMFGGGDNDTYVVDNISDLVSETAADGGTDTVLSSVSFVLSNWLETLVLTGSDDIMGGGNAQNNLIKGNAAANALSGLLGADSLYGNDGADDLFGGEGNDSLLGGDGSDRLHGGDGNDTLTGGAGADQFVFDTAPNALTNADRIRDFVSGQDDLVFDTRLFATLLTTGGTATGALLAAQFHLGSIAGAADDRLIYQQSTGRLFYDSDGTGANAQILVATTAAGTVLLASDILLV